MRFDYHIVDVFTRTPLEGNPLAVVTDASGLDAVTMQRVAKEFNLAETSFILPNESTDFATRVRIFTPNNEMDFAGHPTIGTAYVLRRLGTVPAKATTFTLTENVGPIAVRVDEGDDPLLWLTTPAIRSLGVFPREACAAAVSLGAAELAADVPCEMLSAGHPMLFVAAADAATVDRARVDDALAESLLAGPNAKAGIFVFAPTPAGAYSRMFAPRLGIREDPATGGATGPLAAFMMKYGLASRDDGARFVSEQGTKMGRRSLLHVHVRGTEGRDGIEVGGHVAHVATGVFDTR
jgi:trans-2,3-dihydro-3-hydroxyanthranilate isomerase